MHACVREVWPISAQLALKTERECITITARAPNKHLNFTHALRVLSRLDLLLISGNLSMEIAFGIGSTIYDVFPQARSYILYVPPSLIGTWLASNVNTYSNLPSLSVPLQVLPYEVISN